MPASGAERGGDGRRATPPPPAANDGRPAGRPPDTPAKPVLVFTYLFFGVDAELSFGQFCRV